MLALDNRSSSRTIVYAYLQQSILSAYQWIIQHHCLMIEPAWTLFNSDFIGNHGIMGNEDERNTGKLTLSQQQHVPLLLHHVQSQVSVLRIQFMGAWVLGNGCLVSVCTSILPFL